MTIYYDVRLAPGEDQNRSALQTARRKLTVSFADQKRRTVDSASTARPTAFALSSVAMALRQLEECKPTIH